jgi:cysteine desulfuration protein SufE
VSQMQERQDQVLALFKSASTWEERYQVIIDLGKNSESLPESMKVPEVLVKGCQSQVWLHARRLEDGRIEFRADSDALIVKGLIHLILRVYALATPEEILATRPDYLKQLDLANHLTPNRANGLQAFLKQVFFHTFSSIDRQISVSLWSDTRIRRSLLRLMPSRHSSPRNGLALRRGPSKPH